MDAVSVGQGGPAEALRAEPRLLRWGLPRDPVATRHLTAFVVTTVLTVMVTRGLLAATGFPQLGGDGLHVAHVLWGGLLLAVAVLLLVSFAGPVVRPVGAVVGGVGFGLFIDEIGKFLTDDNDYFYAPSFALMYLTLVALVLGADWLHRRHAHHPAEHLAGAVDYAVGGVVGGLSARSRADAERLLELGAGAREVEQVRALLGAIPDDDADLPDPVAALGRRLSAAVRRVVRSGWSTTVTLLLLAGSILGSFAALSASVETARQQGVAGFVLAGLVTAVVGATFVLRGVVVLHRDRVGAYLWFRRAALLSLLVTQVAVLRFAPLVGAVGIALDVAVLGVVAGERWRVRADARDARRRDQREGGAAGAPPADEGEAS